MNKTEHDHNGPAVPSSDGHHHGQPVSGKRERRGWPFWVALVLMLVALANYMLTGDLGGWRHGLTRQPVPAAVDK